MMSSGTPNSMLGRREARAAATTAEFAAVTGVRGKVIMRGSVLAIRKLGSARRASAGSDRFAMRMQQLHKKQSELRREVL